MTRKQSSRLVCVQRSTVLRTLIVMTITCNTPLIQNILSASNSKHGQWAPLYTNRRSRTSKHHWNKRTKWCQRLAKEKLQFWLPHNNNLMSECITFLLLQQSSGGLDQWLYDPISEANWFKIPTSLREEGEGKHMPLLQGMSKEWNSTQFILSLHRGQLWSTKFKPTGLHLTIHRVRNTLESESRKNMSYREADL